VFSYEIPVVSYEDVKPLPPLTDLRMTRIGLVTSGGLVPRGNPDRQVAGGARACFRYSIENVDALTVADWESVRPCRTRRSSWASSGSNRQVAPV
jgi:betaine reductase